MNWFFYDKTGKKQGPITSAQLKSLAAVGTIVPSTRIATETGREMTADKITGLFPEPPAAAPVKEEEPEKPKLDYSGQHALAAKVEWVGKRCGDITSLFAGLAFVIFGLFLLSIFAGSLRESSALEAAVMFAFMFGLLSSGAFAWIIGNAAQYLLLSQAEQLRLQARKTELMERAFESE